MTSLSSPARQKPPTRSQEEEQTMKANQNQSIDSRVNVRTLAEAVRYPEGKFNGTYMFVDIVGSTFMKQNQPEQSWVTQLGWFYEKTNELVDESGVFFDRKYLGDGIFLSTSDDNATKAVVLAIKLQETLQEANKMNGHAMGLINFNVAISLVSGQSYQFRAPDGLVDYVGMTIDKASRLCGLASPRAIFIDPDTRDAAHMGKVSSRVGEILGRHGDQYLGDRISKPVKGIREAVEYYEVLYDQGFFGVKNEAAGEVVTGNPIKSITHPAPVLPVHERRRFSGTLKKGYSAERGFGFITADNGEDFYLSENVLVYAEDKSKLHEGAQLAFVALPPLQAGKSRRAGAALIVGEMADGELVCQPAAHKPGWIKIEDRLGTQHLVFVTANEQTSGYKKGEILSFEVRANNKGSYAHDIAHTEEESTAA